VRAYELLYIVSPEADEEAIAAVVGKVNGTIESLGGKLDGVIQTEPWGRRRLAYPVGSFEEGFYILCNFSLESPQLGELERVLKLTDGVLRYLLTRRRE